MFNIFILTHTNIVIKLYLPYYYFFTHRFL